MQLDSADAADMKLIGLNRFLLVGCLMTSGVVYGSKDIFKGLDSSSFVKSRGGGVTSSVLGSDALFYNPAGLSWSPLRIDLFGIRIRYSDPTIQEQQSDQSAEADDVVTEFTDIPSALRLLEREKNLHGEYGLRAIDLAIPHFAVTSFASHKIDVEKVEDGTDDAYRLKQSLNAGLIAGLSWRVKKLSIGVSHYALNRGGMVTTIDDQQAADLRAAFDNDTLSESTIDWASSSELSFGGTRGTNVGLMYRPWDDSHSAIGISGLNVGGASFSQKSPLTRDDFEKAYADVQTFADEQGLTLGTPDPIPEIWNAGVTWGWQSSGGFFALDASATWQDIGRPDQSSYVESFSFALKIPDRLALLFSVPIVRLSDNPNDYLHLGLAGLSLSTASSKDRFVSIGSKMSFNLGLARILSLIRIDLEVNTLYPKFTNESQLPISEEQWLVGLTWQM